MNAVDIFAGPGGWDLAARRLGIDPLGIDLDGTACTTRELNGLPTLYDDVAGLDPRDFKATGLIASPPCPPYSRGRGAPAIQHLPQIIEVLQGLARGRDLRAASSLPTEDLLVAEPLRWALTMKPQWIAAEQVPAVLPIWETTAELLSAAGWATATSILNANDFGVPQDRRRAVLVASRHHQPTWPAHIPQVAPSDVLPWNSTDLIGFPRRDDGRSVSLVAANGISYRRRDLRAASEPSFTVTSKARSWIRVSEDTVEPVTFDEVLALQGFPPHRFAGNRTARFEQLANAVPPPLAHAILASLTPR